MGDYERFQFYGDRVENIQALFTQDGFLPGKRAQIIFGPVGKLFGMLQSGHAADAFEGMKAAKDLLERIAIQRDLTHLLLKAQQTAADFNEVIVALSVELLHEVRTRRRDWRR